MGSKAKDASSKVHERNQTILADLLRDEDNRYCADCMAKGPRWASWNLGVFICIRCAGIHRNLGVHISRVKSVNLDAWTPEQMESIQKGGNRHAREIYEANLPANFRRPQDDYAVEQFIRSKYEKKLYIDKGASMSSKAPSTSSSKSTRPAQQENRLKVKKTHERKTTPPKNEVMSVPRPSGARRSPSPQPPLSSSSSKQPSSNSLISLESSPPPSSSTSSSVPVLDLLTDTPPPATTTTKQKAQAQNTPDLLMGPLQSAASSTQQGASFGFFAPSSQGGQQQKPAAPQQLNFGGSGGGSHAPLLLDPSLIPEQTNRDVKDSIMSLYSSSQQQYGSYTAQGYPVNAYHYSQQQQAAMRMAQMQQLSQHRQQQMQLQQVQQQMEKIKVNQQQPAVAVGNGGAFPSTAPGGMGGGHTLNPHLW